MEELNIFGKVERRFLRAEKFGNFFGFPVQPGSEGRILNRESNISQIKSVPVLKQDQKHREVIFRIYTLDLEKLPNSY